MNVVSTISHYVLLSVILSLNKVLPLTEAGLSGEIGMNVIVTTLRELGPGIGQELVASQHHPVMAGTYRQQYFSQLQNQTPYNKIKLTVASVEEMH